MTPEQEIQWREEFERLIKYKGTIRFSGGVYADNRLHQKWIGFKTSKSNSDKEISQLKEQIASIKEIKQYPTALAYISELKEELRLERSAVDRALESIKFVNAEYEIAESPWNFITTEEFIIEIQKQRRIEI